MKRLALSLILVTMSVLASFGRGIMTFSEAQQQAYYLTDKMAYELDLTPAQYDEVYQVNLEYFLNVSGSDPWGYYWNYRNTDLAYILFDWQYNLYRYAEYFYRPIKWHRHRWYLPVWDHYNRTYYYYDRPTIWNTWRGGLWTGRHHNTPSPFIGHRPYSHNGGMRHDPYPGGHPGHIGGGHNGHNGGTPGFNGGGHNGHNGGTPGYNGGDNNRPNGGGHNGYNGGNNNRPNGGGHNGYNGGDNNRPNGGGHNGYNGGGNNNRPNGGYNGGGNINRPNGGGQNGYNGGGNRGGNERPNRGGAQVGGNRGGENRGGGHAGGTRNFGGGRR